MKSKIVKFLTLLICTLCLTENATPQCPATITDTRDSPATVYNVVNIGQQCWMAENLNHGTHVNTSTGQADNGTIEKYCYDDDATNCDTYGGLYEWDEMMDYGTSDAGDPSTTVGICPTGWYIPSDDDWKTLEMNLSPGMTQAQADGTGYRGTSQGDQLKDDNLSPDICNGTPCGTSGFDGLLGGVWYSTFFDNIDEDGDFWSATESDASNAFRRLIHVSRSDANRNSVDKSRGLYVRCVQAAIPLPIELLFFDAEWANDDFEKVNITWATASERNNDHFDIERSLDGINFTTIEQVLGAVNSQQVKNYATVDQEPYREDVSYYRLKWVDLNGDFTYSNIVALNIPDGLDIIALYPNPVSENLFFSVLSSGDWSINVSITNALGQHIKSFESTVSEGVTPLQFNVSDLNSGNYLLQINTTDGKYQVQRQFIR